jgi:hypothetical protein
MRPAAVPLAQMLTATAAVFTVLCGCGVVIQRGPRPTVDLTGTWEGTIERPPDPPLPARIEIAAPGSTPRATLTIAGTVYGANPTMANYQNRDRFVFCLQNGQARVTLTGGLSPDRRFLDATIDGLGLRGRRVILYRR